jgi:hypothetical protein
VDILRRRLGEWHTDYATALFTLANVRSHRDDLAGAETLLQQAAAIYRKKLGDEHPDLAAALAQIGVVKAQAGDPAAEQFLRDAIVIQRRQPAGTQAALVLSLSELALLLRKRGDHSGEVQALREVVQLQRGQLAADSAEMTTWCLHLAAALTRLAVGTASAADARAAQGLAREALAGRRRHVAEDNWMVGIAKLTLADALAAEASFPGAAADALAEAETLVLESSAVLDDASRFPASARSTLTGLILEASTRIFATLQRLQPSDERTQRAAAWRAKLAPRAGGDDMGK